MKNLETHLLNTQPTPEYALIDCRSAGSFHHAHHRYACHIDANELFERMHELPSKETPLIIISCQQSHAAASRFLLERGYRAEFYYWSAELKNELEQADLLSSGSNPIYHWQPAPIIANFVQQIMPQENINAGKALDIAAGAGRDACYLAMHGWQVSAVDNNQDALKRCLQIAKSNNSSVHCQNINLSDSNALGNHFEPNSFDLIVVSRFLHRPLFAEIKQLLKPQGIIIYQTFMQGCELISSPKNPRYLLAEGELKSLFSDFQILEDRVTYLSDTRPVSYFIARKPS